MSYYDRYKRLAKKLRSLFLIPIYNDLQAQIEAFIVEFKKNPHAIPTTLPEKQLYDTLMSLYQVGGIPMAEISLRNVQADLSAAQRALIDPKGLLSQADLLIKLYYDTFVMSKIVAPITQTTRNEINRILKLQFENGWGVDETVSKLRQNEVTKSRAELIVRTESMRAANTGAMIGAAASPIAVMKRWISAQDQITRRIPRNQYDHLHMNNVTVDFDKPFIIPSTVSIDAMQMPGDPAGSAGNVCNCRCVVAFIPIRNSDGELVKVEDYPPQMSSIFRSLYAQLRGSSIK